MKILIISPKFHPIIGGGETFVLNSVKRLYDAGIDVSIAVTPNSSRKMTDYPFKVHEIEGLSDSDMSIIEATKNLNILIKREKPDILHVHGYFALLITGFCNTLDIPIIVSIHSTPVWNERIIGGMNDFEVELSFARKALAVGKPKILTAANEVYADAARKIVQAKQEVVVLPYPVDTDSFYKQSNIELRLELGLKSTDVLITVPSRIIERKGIKEAVNSLLYLPAHFYLFLPAAYEPLDKEYWSSIINQSHFKNINNRILIPNNRVVYYEMPAVYGATDIVAMPSYYEGAPVATVEAMASGKPFVGADSQGINGFINHRENGLLVPQKSSQALANSIRELHYNSSLGNKLANQARKDILCLSWTEQLPNLIRLYESLVHEEVYGYKYVVS